jgi:AcrR family transcriptional regulator
MVSSSRGSIVRRPSRTVRRRRRARSGAADLGHQLLNAATALITERGPRGFSLREVARRASVSEAAPYWHFASKEALLAAVAEQGFVGLAAAMAAVRQRVKDPRRQLRELGDAYVRFALAHPSHLRVMFGPEIRDKSAHPTLKAAAEKAFDLLVSTIADGQRAGHVKRGDAGELAVSTWALVHGLASLLIDGQLRRRARSSREVKMLTTRATQLLQTGLAKR